MTPRRQEIARRWIAGETLREIADALGSTQSAVGVTLVRIRELGVELPYRRAAYAEACAQTTDWTDRRALLATLRQAETISVFANDPCTYCGGPTGGGVDHIVPRVAGGAQDESNLTASCRSCNTAKCDTPLLRFLLLSQLKRDVAPMLATIRFLNARSDRMSDRGHSG
jgi:hypothetical protein